MERIAHKFEGGVELKFCRRCASWHPLENFYVSSKTWDKLYWYCSTCISLINSEQVKKRAALKGPYIQRTNHRVDGGVELKLCNKCHRWLPLDKFHKTKGTWDCRKTQCVECNGRRDVQWRARNEDRRREYNLQWEAQNADKIREIRKSLSKRLREYVRHTRAYANWRREQVQKHSSCSVISGPGTKLNVHHYSRSSLSIIEEVARAYSVAPNALVDKLEKSVLEKIIKDYNEINSQQVGVPLTRAEHNEFHRLYGRTNNTPEQFEAFFKTKIGKDFKEHPNGIS